jgi:hypothetical protein
MVCRPIERKDYKPGKVDETDERQIWIPDEWEQEKLNRKEETTDWTKGGCTEMKKHLIERKNAQQEGKMPVERKARTDWMQGGSTSNQRKCSKKRKRQSWCVETNECRGNSNGRLIETCQENKKLPSGTGVYSWMSGLIWSKEKSKRNKQHEYLVNDGETWWNDLGISTGNWMDPNFKSHHALQMKSKCIKEWWSSIERKKEAKLENLPIYVWKQHVS